MSCTETAGLPLHPLSVPHNVLHRDSRSASPAFVSPSQCLALRQLVRVNLSVTSYQDNVSLSPAFRESVRVQIIVIHSYRDTNPSLSSESVRVQIIVIHSYQDTSPCCLQSQSECRLSLFTLTGTPVPRCRLPSERGSGEAGTQTEVGQRSQGSCWDSECTPPHRQA